MTPSTITREAKTQNGHLKNALLASAERSEEGGADTHTQLETHTRVYIEISSIINLRFTFYAHTLNMDANMHTNYSDPFTRSIKKKRERERERERERSRRMC